MRRRRVRHAAVCGICLVVAAAVGSPIAAQTRQPTLALPADMVGFFAGTWAGRGSFQTGKPLESDLQFEPAIDKLSLLVRHHEHSPSTFEFIAIWSVDAATDTPVMLMTSNHNSGARLLRSHGWRDSTIVFESDPVLRAPFALERFTFQRVADNAFKTMYEYSIDDGATWRIGDRQEFTRTQ